MDCQLESFNFQLSNLSESEAEMIALHIDGEVSRTHGLFFDAAVHNWDEEARTFSGHIECRSEHVAQDALRDAVDFAHKIYEVSEAA